MKNQQLKNSSKVLYKVIIVISIKGITIFVFFLLLIYIYEWGFSNLHVYIRLSYYKDILLISQLHESM